MSVAASRPPAPVGTSAPLPPPTPADRESDSPAFAELLRQSRGVERRPMEAPKAATDARAQGPQPDADPMAASDETAPASDSAPKSDAGRARARAGATSARSAAAAGPAERTERTERRPEPVAEGGTPEDDRSSTDASSANAGASSATTGAHPVRPHLARPVDAELRLGGAAHRPGRTLTAGRDAEASGVRAEAVAIDPGADGDAVGRRSGAQAASRTDAGRGAPHLVGDAATAAASFAKDLADAKSADRPAAGLAPVEPLPLSTTLIAAPEAQSSATAETAPAPQAASLPVGVDSPEFAAAFGVQVSVFVREGVQHAELHLNPVETGPVSIAITLEGSQAHVEFGADLAATRQAIENGLPALASALRDAGFTLAGGGVAQHSRSGSGRGQDDASGGRRHGRHPARASDVMAAATVQRASHRIAAGGIDLYA